MTVINPNNFQTVEDEYLEVMPNTVRCTQATPKNSYGKRIGVGIPVTSPAYLETKHESFTTDDGDITVATGRAFLGYVIPWLTVDDKFEIQNLAGVWETVTMKFVDAIYGPEGVHHQEVWYGGRGAAVRRS